jgi:sugar phosphate isomerase/epimerase
LGGAAFFAFPNVPEAMSGDRFFRSHNLAIGIQLYVLGDLIKSDLDGVLGTLSRIGYREVESAGFAGHSLARFGASLHAAHLKCISAHLPARSDYEGELSLSSNERDLADAVIKLGLEAIVLPMFSMPDRFRQSKTSMEYVVKHLTADDWKKTADFLNDKGRVIRNVGARLAYHCHNPEYYSVAGSTGLDILARNTDPELVDFEIDTGWAAAAGRDPLAVLSSYSERVRMIHVKDLKPTPVNNWLQMNSADLGAGTLDWKKILPAAYRLGVRHFLVEQEPPYANGRIIAAERDFSYLSQLLTT